MIQAFANEVLGICNAKSLNTALLLWPAEGANMGLALKNKQKRKNKKKNIPLLFQNIMEYIQAICDF